MRALFVLLLLLTAPVFAAEPKLKEDLTVKVAGKTYKIHFNTVGAEYCSYDALEIRQGKKLLANLKDLCGTTAEQWNKHYVTRAFGIVMKLGPKKEDEYLYMAQMDGLPTKATLVAFEPSPPHIVYTGEVSGQFEDYNGDGLKDLLKKGGGGEPRDEKGNSSYDPYLVYLQKKTKEGIDFVKDVELSKKFSAMNGFEWHGPAYDGNTIVDKTGKIVK